MLVAAALLALAPAHAEDCCALPDAGVTIVLPPGGSYTRWSNWDLKGKTADGGVAIDVWFTPFQLAVTEQASQGWAALYKDRLDDMRATNIVRDSGTIGDVDGRPTARTTMKFSFDAGGPKGVMYIAAFPTDGKIVHIATLAAAPNAARAEHTLDGLLEKLTVQSPAAEIVKLGGQLPTELGFEGTLPDGWRRPLPSEADAAAEPLANLGISPTNPDKCVRAIHPRPSGEADLLLMCQEDWKLGIIDDASFADEEAGLKTRFFGKAAGKIPPAARLERNDRLGFLLAPEINGRDLRLAALPYDRGTVVAWAVGQSGSAADLESVLRAVSSSLTFSGPEGGADVHDAGEWIVHTLTYNPFHPAVLGAGVLFLAVLGGIGFVVFRGGKKPETPGL
jgi:hypothetical protein